MYLLNEALRLKNQQMYRQSYVINEQKIAYLRERIPYWKKRKVNMSNIVIAPAKVAVCERILHHKSEEERHLIEKQWLKRGVATLIVYTDIQSERKLVQGVEAAHRKMQGNSLDYVLGISIPLRLFKPTVFRVCRKLNVPIIRVQITSEGCLHTLPWSYYADAAVTYPCLLIPNIKSERKIEISRLWKQQCEWFGLSTAIDTDIWTKELLQKSGMYPEKGELLVGSDADYVLYHLRTMFQASRQARKLATNPNLDYDKDEPAIVVQRAQILKANHSFYLDEKGKHIKITKPKRMLSMEFATSTIDVQHQLKSAH